MTVFDLWLPILLAGLATHVASTIAWTALPHHKPEWKKLPEEDAWLEFLTTRQPPAEQYMFPFCQGGEEFKTAEFQAKLRGGWQGMLVLWDAPLSMGRAIGQTLAYFLVAAFLIGYIASIAFPTGEANKIDIFRLVFTAGVLCHALSPFPHAFWFRQKVAMQVVDGVVFAGVTAVVFTWMWPAVS